MSSRRRPPVNGKVSKALKPYRARLRDHSVAFTKASVKLAHATIGQTPFNRLTPETTAALAALATWQRDVERARKKVRAVSSKAPGQKLALQWLGSLSASLGFMNQSLSLTDPQLASTAAKRAERSFRESHQLSDRLARVIV